MPKNKASRSRSNESSRADKRKTEDASTLKELLDPQVVHQLKARAADLKEQEKEREQEKKRKAAEERKAELKRLENDFEHLLKNSNMDWKKFK